MIQRNRQRRDLHGGKSTLSALIHPEDTKMSLRAKQSEFARMVPRLIDHAHELGFEVTLGDAYRDPRCPYGSKSSRHKVRLAIDLNLFRDGVYLTETSDHAILGQWWEEQGGVWGGRFDDGNHYEWPIT